MSAITLKVNGQTHTLDLDPTTPLLYALSDDLALRGPKFGCGLGQCGACTAIVNGAAIHRAGKMRNTRALINASRSPPRLTKL